MYAILQVHVHTRLLAKKIDQKVIGGYVNQADQLIAMCFVC